MSAGPFHGTALNRAEFAEKSGGCAEAVAPSVRTIEHHPFEGTTTSCRACTQTALCGGRRSSPRSASSSTEFTRHGARL